MRARGGRHEGRRGVAAGGQAGGGMKRRGPRPVGIALEALTDAIVPATLLAEVQRAWPQAAGEAFARATEPVAERDGVITVACDSAVWAQELDLFSERVVGALNEAIGRPAVRRLRPRALPARL
jgi:predicted nucleic acid-binding Zn ribbon protein